MASNIRKVLAALVLCTTLFVSAVTVAGAVPAFPSAPVAQTHRVAPVAPLHHDGPAACCCQYTQWELMQESGWQAFADPSGQGNNSIRADAKLWGLFDFFDAGVYCNNMKSEAVFYINSPPGHQCSYNVQSLIQNKNNGAYSVNDTSFNACNQNYHVWTGSVVVLCGSTGQANADYRDFPVDYADVSQHIC